MINFIHVDGVGDVPKEFFTPPIPIREKIFYRKEELNMSNAELARMTGMSNSTISRIINEGICLTPKGLAAIIAALKVPCTEEDAWWDSYEPWRPIYRYGRTQGWNLEKINLLLDACGKPLLSSFE